MYHIFDIDIAKEYGVEQAIVISNFQFWIKHNAANKKNFRNGKYWTYNSVSALQVIFPYWSSGQIKRIIHDLEEKQVLESATFNKENFDKTKWYAFKNEHRWIGAVPLPENKQPIGRNQPMDDLDLTIPLMDVERTLAENGQPIPYNTNNQFITTDSKQQIKEVVANEKFATPAFVSANQVKAGAEQSPPVAPTPHARDGQESTTNRPAGKKSRVNPILEQLPVDPGKSLKKKKETLSQFMMKTYFDWHEDNVGVKPIIDGIQGKAMKKLVKYFEDIALKFYQQEVDAGKVFPITEDWVHATADKAWCMVLQAIGAKSDKVEDFYKKVKLNEISSNLPNIINQIKNGNPKNKSAAGKTSGIDEIERELRMEKGDAFS